MQRMSKDNTPIIPNPTEKVKPFCKKNRTENPRLFVYFCQCRKYRCDDPQLILRALHTLSLIHI